MVEGEVEMSCGLEVKSEEGEELKRKNEGIEEKQAKMKHQK